MTTQRGSAIGWLICSLAMLFYAYEFLLRISPSVMSNELQQFFHLSATGFGSLIGLYYFAYTPMQLFVGPAVDLYGPRYILTFATLLCAMGTLMFATTNHVAIAGAGRFLIGFGSAFAFVGALKLAAVWLPINRFATFAGLVTALAMVGGMVGDPLLTELVQHVGWQQTLLYAAVAGLLLAPLIAIVVRNHPADSKPLPLVHHDLWKEFLKIIGNYRLWVSGFVACMLYLSLSAFAESWGIPFLKGAFHFSADQASIANAMIFFGWLIGSPLTGFISDLLQRRSTLLVIGCFFSAACIAAVLYLPMHSFFLVALLLFSFGLFASTEIVCFAIGHDSAPKQVAGTAVAFINMLTMLGGFVFQPLIGKLLDMNWSGVMHDHIRVYSLHEYRVALTALPIGLLIGGLLLLTVRTKTP